MEQITDILVHSPKVTDKGISQLKRFIGLRTLYYTHLQISDSTAEALKKALPGLERCSGLIWGKE
ncbi:MAG: hypothetical protein HQ564_02905 [Candidatus Saganbacteria bacterium]|nr:hypothetical protein [Candidatus Saganbacteria bacterium]